MAKLIITEEQSNILAKRLNEEFYQMPVDKKHGKPYTINPENVKLVRRFLDNNFKKGNYEDIGPNGMPCKTRVAGMLSSDGEVIKGKEAIPAEQLCDILVMNFKNMFIDKIEREMFMKQVVKDWFDNKIGVLGNLSVNRLI